MAHLKKSLTNLRLLILPLNTRSYIHLLSWVFWGNSLRKTMWPRYPQKSGSASCTTDPRCNCLSQHQLHLYPTCSPTLSRSSMAFNSALAILLWTVVSSPPSVRLAWSSATSNFWARGISSLDESRVFPHTVLNGYLLLFHCNSPSTAQHRWVERQLTHPFPFFHLQDRKDFLLSPLRIPSYVSHLHPAVLHVDIITISWTVSSILWVEKSAVTLVRLADLGHPFLFLQGGLPKVGKLFINITVKTTVDEFIEPGEVENPDNDVNKSDDFQ